MRDGYEFVAIGSGPAGESAAELAAFFGHPSAVIEKARPGGTVTTTGGVPTKTLREAALYFSVLCEGGIYGLRTAAPVEVAIDTIRKRTWDVCGLLQKETAENIAKNHVDYIEGEACLHRDGTVVVATSDGRASQTARFMRRTCCDPPKMNTTGVSASSCSAARADARSCPANERMGVPVV